MAAQFYQYNQPKVMLIWRLTWFCTSYWSKYNPEKQVEASLRWWFSNDLAGIKPHENMGENHHLNNGYLGNM